MLHAIALSIFLVLPAVGQDKSTYDAEELEEAQREVPQLARILELAPGMSFADVGAGFGAWTVVVAKWLGPAGRVYSTDIADAQLAALRAAVEAEALTNVVVLRGGADAANLPAACCEVILLRNVYHHLREPAVFNETLLAALRPGGRLAIIDFEPRPGSEVPDGVDADRDGHGIAASVTAEELRQAGLLHVDTRPWPADSDRSFLVVMRKP